MWRVRIRRWSRWSRTRYWVRRWPILGEVWRVRIWRWSGRSAATTAGIRRRPWLLGDAGRRREQRKEQKHCYKLPHCSLLFFVWVSDGKYCVPVQRSQETGKNSLCQAARHNATTFWRYTPIVGNVAAKVATVDVPALPARPYTGKLQCGWILAPFNVNAASGHFLGDANSPAESTAYPAVD